MSTPLIGVNSNEMFGDIGGRSLNDFLDAHSVKKGSVCVSGTVNLLVLSRATGSPWRRATGGSPASCIAFSAMRWAFRFSAWRFAFFSFYV